MLGSPLSSLLVVVGRRGAARSLSSLSPASPYPLPQPSPSSSLLSISLAVAEARSDTEDMARMEDSVSTTRKVICTEGLKGK